MIVFLSLDIPEGEVRTELCMTAISLMIFLFSLGAGGMDTSRKDGSKNSSLTWMLSFLSPSFSPYHLLSLSTKSLSAHGPAWTPSHRNPLA